jgi:hypothetical protein
VKRRLAVVLLALASCTSPAAPRPVPVTPAPTPLETTTLATVAPSRAGEANQPTLVWTPRRLDDGVAARAAALARASVAVSSGTAWLTASTDGRGRRVDAPAAGFAIPVEVAAAGLAAYARLVPGAASLAGLRSGQVVLGAASARLRRLGAGATLVFGAVTLRVAAVVPDAAVGYAEVFAAPADAVRLGVTTRRYLLADATPDAARRIAALRPAPRVRLPGEARWLRAADAVLPPVLEKAAFGEFAATRPAADGSITLDPGWRARHLATATVPLLGRVTCNAALLAPLRAALDELVARGLSSLVHGYGGCFVARVVREDVGGSLSHHAWGGAVDVNVAENPFGGRPHQDPRLVAVFVRHGFGWGGDWLVPDGMHFDYLG